MGGGVPLDNPNRREFHDLPTPSIIRTIAPRSKPLQETRVLLLRHAETSSPDCFHGAESDIDLGDRGRSQAATVAVRLAAFRPDAVYSSGMLRARETATPIAGACQLVPQVIETLHERRMGPLSGQPKAEGWSTYQQAMTHWMAGDLDYTHEGGESFADIAARTVPPFQALADRHRGETIVVVAHGVVIRVLLCSLVEDLSQADFADVPIEFVGVNDLRWNGTRWSAVGFERNGSPSQNQGGSSEPLKT
ncbi:fructose-2,6-bisphosphatase [Singulisphaera acidiphila DSM 18658]|uniref:Fructose-2,6-bisphosphatase n=1 Tax=Singulisphaera acidiphila (strain ATCC BAA-1392 / DSM 18658 / VKM B-2454 / MOB10) TaxID=886293 RepID=L0DAN2_SINAD|nr:fructose-2,6-bisphosphatase [Singulisphaera acidiphila DSM 18658]